MSSFGTKQSMLDAFLTEVVSHLRRKNGNGIAALIQLDFESLVPQRQKSYADLNRELNSSHAADDDAGLVRKCKQVLSQDEFGSFSTSFSDSLVQYFRYVRDFTSADNQTKALKIRQLTSQCVAALGDSKYGVVMIPVVLSFSRTLAAVATNLDRNPSLLKQAELSTTRTADETPGKVTFVEDAANVLRDAFIKCLAGSPGVQRTTRPGPDDKRIGIYLTANSCLKLLFQCRKLRNAQQMFLSIDAQSPPLSFYPAAQRVTYLYYLGRYHFANSHFYRAQTVLQAAYDQCHRQATKHRRLILTYLIASNICLGRFPSSKLLMRREASEIAKRFLPLCKIIKSGDLRQFHQYMDLTNESAQWFLQKRILLQLQSRCEIIVWRSLIRKIFVFEGYKGEEKKVPFLRLGFVQHAASWILDREKSPENIGSTSQFASNLGGQPFSPTNPSEDYIDPDLADIDAAVNETGFDLETGNYHDDQIGHNQSVDHANDDNNSQPFEDDDSNPILYEIESVFLSLIQQGLLRGFMLHTNPRFAIPGSKNAGGPLLAGFPSVWSVVSAREMGTSVVPGWVNSDVLGGAGGGSMAGRVVRLSGARAVGEGS